jgi:hypothetical protein
MVIMMLMIMMYVHGMAPPGGGACGSLAWRVGA